MIWKISSSRSDMMRCRCSTLTVLSGRPSSLVMVMVWPLTASSTSAEPCSSFNFSARLNGTFKP